MQLPRLGLKLWSVNTANYSRAAARLYAEGVYDYIELYVVPGTGETLPTWKSLSIPFIIHCPHFAHGFNLAQEQYASRNREMFREVRTFADALQAPHIVIHGGMGGDARETARQLKELHEPRALIENKPHHVLRDDGSRLICRGALPEEIELICREAGCGFCLDFEHALCSANSHGIPLQQMLGDMVQLNPVMFHLSGIEDRAEETDTHQPLAADAQAVQEFLAYVRPGQCISIETIKSPPYDLEDFRADVALLKQLWTCRNVGGRM